MIVVGNAWVFAEYEGQWYAATFEYMRVGQTRKYAAAVDGDHIERSPFPIDWRPASGQQLYFMVSGLIRNPPYDRNIEERPNIVSLIWP